MFSEIHLLILLQLLLMLTTTTTCSSSYINNYALGSDWYHNLTCGSVPYPFGIAGIAFSGFELDCPMGLWMGPPYLPISDRNYIVQAISLQGYINILSGQIQRWCIGSDGKYTEPQVSQLFNLERTPFALSYQYNMLTVFGCNNLVKISKRDTNLTSGCVTFCDSQDTLSDGSCSGLGCCQATLPGAIKSFDLQFTQVGVHLDSANCSTVYFAQRDDFQPNKSRFLFDHEITSDIYDRDTYDSSNGQILMQLNWAIGDQSCAVARDNIHSFACKNNSYCYELPSMPGYLCNCNEGYEGNPYTEDGCTDIDECLQSDFNPCVGHCNNLPGTYACYCPQGMTGDGKKGGSGCKKAFPLDVTLGAGLGLIFILVVSSFFSYWVLQKRRIVKMRSQFFTQNGGHLLEQRLASQGIDAAGRIFTENELEKATESYNESKILGEGGHGTVYKGTLSDLRVVAIKKSKIEDESQIEQFINEIVLLSQINHRNVVRLLGCCLETRVPLLVYEFVPNGTLLHLIQSQRSGFYLPWDCRLRILSEAAGALAYLHSAASFPIIHRDIKSSNILLDENFTTKVSDFGASRSVPFDKTHLTTLVQGTFGYLDPEYFQTSQLSAKSDVYSFGVVLAELLTGEKPISFARPEEFHNLAMYFTVAFDEARLHQVIDPPVAREAGAEELYAIAYLTRRCLNTKGEERPTMKDVALELDALRRMRNPQMQSANGDIQQFMNVLSSEIVECTKQHSLEGHMLSSMDLPR